MKQVVKTFGMANTVYPAGMLVDDNDPLVKGREAFFAEAVPAGAVEQATASPGESRSVVRKKAKKSKSD